MEQRPRVVMAVDSNRRFGGASIRRSCIRAALKSSTTVATFDLACTRAHDPPASRPNGPGAHSYSRRFCHHAASRLERFLRHERPDFVVLSGLEFHHYVDVASHAGTDVIVDLHNAELFLFNTISALYERYQPTVARASVRARIREVERDLIRRCRWLWTCTDENLARLHEEYGVDRGKASVVHNTAPPGSLRVHGDGGSIARILFPASLDYLPNIDAGVYLIEEVAPYLLRRGRDIPIVIAGRKPHPIFTDASLPSNVTLATDVADMDPLWSGSALISCLRYGTGSRIKVLEAFARGVPVISTACGMDGISGAAAGTHFALAESPVEILESLGDNAASVARRRAQTDRALQLQSQRYSIAAIAKQIADTWRRL